MTKIAITGTPGTGKTLVAEHLSRIAGLELIDMKPLLERAKIGYDKKRGSDIIDQDILSEQVKKLGKKGFIIESHLAHLVEKGIVDLCVVLMASPLELRKRLEKRGWSREKIDENVLAEQMKICYGEALESCEKVVEYDTTGKTPEQSAKDIWEMVC